MPRAPAVRLSVADRLAEGARSATANLTAMAEASPTGGLSGDGRRPLQPSSSAGVRSGDGGGGGRTAPTTL
jgi:hypothetical protein